MNEWQKHYVNELYDGKKPRSKRGKLELELLGKVREKITVHFPEFHSPVKSQNSPAHNETYVVTFDECNMPEGKISVLALASNLSLWTERGYGIDY